MCDGIVVKMGVSTCAVTKCVHRNKFIPKICQLLLVGSLRIGSMGPVASGSFLDELKRAYENFSVSFLDHKIWKQIRQQFSHCIWARFPLMQRRDPLVLLEMCSYRPTEVGDKPFHHFLIRVRHAQDSEPIIRLGVGIETGPRVILGAIQAKAPLSVDEAREVCVIRLFTHVTEVIIAELLEQHYGPVWKLPGLGLMRPVGGEAVGV